MRAVSVISVLIAVAGIGVTITAGLAPAKSFLPVFYDGTVAVGDHHHGLNAPGAGRVHELVWTQDGAGGGAPGEATNFGVLRRLPDAGFELLCEITVPCNLTEGQHAYPDGGSMGCQPQLSPRDHLDYTVTSSTCGSSPRGILTTTFSLE